MDRWDLLKPETDKRGGTGQLIVSATTLLRDHERELLQIPKVALYDREEPMAEFHDGSLVVTNHRLLWRNSVPSKKSLALSLSLISRHSTKSGFLTSSPKVILYLRTKSAQCPAHPSMPVLSSVTSTHLGENDRRFAVTNWICDICNEGNPGEALKCVVCGVFRKKTVPTSAPLRAPPSLDWACDVCTFENKLDQMTCDMCGTPKKILSPPPSYASPNLSDISTGSQVLMDPSSVGESYVKLSFRGGTGTSNFVAHLQMVLQKQDWKTLELEVQKLQDTQKTPDTASTVGVAALLQRFNLDHKSTDESLSLAFNDLQSLMHKAGDMVKLAETISLKLASKTENVDDAMESSFRKLLLEIGLVEAIVTKEVSGSAFHAQLSTQLGAFVVQLLERRQTLMLPLADIYCLYNRSRGTNLVSPDDIYRATQLFDHSSSPVTLRRLPSGLIVVQKRAHSGDQAALTQILSMIAKDHPDSWSSTNALEVSRAQKVSLTVALMFLQEAEAKGLVCRDESPSGTHYYRNFILSL